MKNSDNVSGGGILILISVVQIVMSVVVGDVQMVLVVVRQKWGL